MVAALFTVSAILLTVFALYIYQKRKLRYWARKGIPYNEPHFLFGNVKKVITLEHSIHEFVDEQYQKSKSLAVFGCFAFSKPVLIIRDLDIVKDVTTKEFGSFVNRSFNADKSFDTLAGRLLFSRKDDEWRVVRHKMSLAFSNAKLKKMFPTVKETVEELMHTYKAHTNTGERTFEVTDLSMRYAVDSITAICFGSQGNALREYPQKSLMFRILGKLLSFDTYQGIANNLIFFARPLYVLAGRLGLPFRIISKQDADAFMKIVDLALHQRLQDKERKNDIFDHIVWTNVPGLEGLENKTGAAVQMLLAGAETTAVTTAFALYELAKNPPLQDRLRKEIIETLNQNNGKVDYAAINQMVYLNQVVNETLRLWPILPFLDRVCQKPYHVPGTDIVIDEGTQVFIPAYSLQRDPQYFRDPEKFDPDRFSKENIGSIPEFAYIPFGAGPRYCVGKRFGVLSVKTVLVHFLKTYEVRTTNDTFRTFEWNKKALTLNLKNGLTLLVRPLT